MLECISYLHQMYKDSKNENDKKDLIKKLIINEAKINSDILDVIVNTGIRKTIAECPEILCSLESSSLDFITAMGIDIRDIFDDKPVGNKYPNSSKTYQHYAKKNKAELYDFYIRKSKLLKKLVESKSINVVKIGLTARIKNIQIATKLISLAQD